mmetsp:Transcript_59744/g.117206  ORF Transcript_59744/g.117206 Transcript_59744/m.117206 type:complete len:407 (+) Transcript_59744:33-1253(+)
MDKLHIKRAVELFEQLCKRESKFSAAPKDFFGDAALRAMNTARIKLDPVSVLAMAVHLDPHVIDALHLPEIVTVINAKAASLDMFDEASKKWRKPAQVVAAWLQRFPRELAKAKTLGKALTVVSAFCTEGVVGPSNPTESSAAIVKSFHSWLNEPVPPPTPSPPPLSPRGGLVGSNKVGNDLTFDETLRRRVCAAIAHRKAEISRLEAEAIAAAEAAAEWARYSKACEEYEAMCLRAWRVEKAVWRIERTRRGGSRNAEITVRTASEAFECSLVNNKAKSPRPLMKCCTSNAIRATRKAIAKGATAPLRKEQVVVAGDDTARALQLAPLKKWADLKARASAKTSSRETRMNPSFKKSKSRTGKRLLGRKSKAELMGSSFMCVSAVKTSCAAFIQGNPLGVCHTYPP